MEDVSRRNGEPDVLVDIVRLRAVAGMEGDKGPLAVFAAVKASDGEERHFHEGKAVGWQGDVEGSSRELRDVVVCETEHPGIGVGRRCLCHCEFYSVIVGSKCQV